DAGDAVQEYAWRLIKKPLGSRTVVLNPTASSFDITLDRIGLYTFGLTVKDSKGAASSEDTVSVGAFAGGSYCGGESCTECLDSDRDGMCDSDESIGTKVSRMRIWMQRWTAKTCGMPIMTSTL
ncbi:MAG: hypothetical protein GW861_15020, partial [Deltaproteobacteria bacterium]|nr:hypothetical protein [Deltaproteobacteria bacterium]